MQALSVPKGVVRQQRRETESLINSGRSQIKIATGNTRNVNRGGGRGVHAAPDVVGSLFIPESIYRGGFVL